ncbi:glycosyltransferase family 39 protein [bacterium]|nr:glycosyltransferase family 39 protein [bacterium]MBU3956535.1 glycosyltransferase family 39 protein [bacterium]
MKKPKKSKHSFLPLIISIAVFLMLGGMSVLKKSPVYDETLHLADGMAYHKFHNFRFGIEHPPLLRYIAGFSSYFTKAVLPDEASLVRTENEIRVNTWSPGKDFVFADTVFFKNGNDAARLLFTGRMLLLLLGIPLILIIHRWAKELYGEKAANMAAFMLALSPNMLAHARLVTTDFGSVAFSVMASYFLWKYTKKQNLKNLLPASILWSLALASKHTVIFYFMAFHLSAFFFTGDKKKFLAHFLIQVPIIIFIINLSYMFAEPVCGNFFKGGELNSLPVFVRGALNLASKISFLPETYLKGVAYSFFHSRRGHSAYLLGMYSVRGWPYYFPLAIIIKSTLAGIVLSMAAIISATRAKINRDELFFILPAAAFLIFIMKSNLNIGIRHALFLWPFAFLFFSRARRLLKGPALAAMVALALFENLSIFPDYISHFNFVLGGPRQGIKYLGDSNLDWGQGLKQFAGWWKKEGSPPLILSYFGSGSPRYYGITYQGCMMNTPVGEADEFINPENTEKEYFAVSATNLQGIYFGNFGQTKPFTYFLSKKPVKICGSSIYVYDISGDYLAHMLLGAIYRAHGKKELSDSEFRKAVRINPQAEKTIRDYFSKNG